MQVLALDGGGAKALFTINVLARLEEDLGVCITDAFDLIAGTSAGGIIALGLGAGLSPAEIADHYESLVTTIFPASRRTRRSLMRRITHPQYDADALTEALKDVLGDRLLGESVKPLVVTSWDVRSGEVHLFKTPHHRRLTRDWKIPMVDVARATSAAPTFFAPATVDDQHLIDGGIWANNPSVVAIAEAVSMLEAPLSQIKVLNVGTTDTLGMLPNSIHTGGLKAWLPHVLPLLMRAGSKSGEGVAEHLVGPENYTRFDVVVPEGTFTLDTQRTADLKALASGAARRLGPAYTARFAAHNAAAYQPHVTPDQIARQKERLHGER
ncbi:CBASS cGAMP-activated phospholipase [Phycicoccus duodecadis]|uniref:Patatin-like phospholipase n=1 Tax=Phycicoccus duodecadis TaxID=173053 RepID=A0A2N3YG02_9MICO|nr:CBASS cGAMP-activated phospholipase [Phycicoccus duodecadis]PKW25740.1 patatin-like phospholipase [Phycicoccus duodecadis]